MKERDTRDSNNRGTRRANETRQKKRFKVNKNRRDNGSRRESYEGKDNITFNEDSHVGDNGCNDPSWYGVGNTTMDATLRIPQLQPLGKLLNWRTYSGGGSKWQISRFRFPGILNYRWAPCFIDSDVSPNPLNASVGNMYSFVRHANSGHTNYTPGTLGCYMIAGTQLISWIANLRRVYGVMHNFDGTNNYTPRAIVEAMGFDYFDLRKNLTQFFGYINYITTQCSSIWIPVTNPLVARWEFMNSYIYADSETIKPQIYFYSPAGFYRWLPEASRPGEAGLYYTEIDMNYTEVRIWNESFKNDPRYWLQVGMQQFADQPADTAWSTPDGSPAYVYYGSPRKLTFAGLQRVTDTLVNDFIFDEDRGIIAGDLLKAYGADAMYKWPLMPENYTVIPQFNKEVVDQFRNVRVLNFSEFKGQNIFDQGAELTFSDINSDIDTGTALGDCGDISTYLTFDRIANEADLAIATRMIPFTNGSGRILSAGSEIVTRMYVITLDDDGEPSSVGFSSYLRNHINSFDILSKLRAFSMAPAIYIVNVEGGGVRTVLKNYFIDADNAFPYTYDDAIAINNAALLFEYGVPLSTGVGKGVK